MTVKFTGALPRGEVLPQKEVQRSLCNMANEGADLHLILRELESWSESVGYFNHLTGKNEYLSFPDKHLRLNLRLQVNFSRLSYRKPEGDDLPKCPLCIENVGVRGKELLRIYEFNLNKTCYFAHLTPFPLYTGHFVMNLCRHEAMRIARRSLNETAEFLFQTSSWLAASNSDVEWAGASVLGHHHVQLFRKLSLPIEEASVYRETETTSARLELLNWPCPTVRITGDSQAVLNLGGALIDHWKATDPGKATFNYLMRSGWPNSLTLYMLFRHPDYRTPEHLRIIKSEGVGIIEMAGEVIVPPLPDKSREENRAYFEENGLAVTRGIISGNSPVDEDRTLDYYFDIIQRAARGG